MSAERHPHWDDYHIYWKTQHWAMAVGKKDLWTSAVWIFTIIHETILLLPPRRVILPSRLGVKSLYSDTCNAVCVSQVVLACLSSEFVSDDHCKKLFYLANNSMQKVLQVVLLGASQNWMKTTDIGVQISSEVCTPSWTRSMIGVQISSEVCTPSWTKSLIREQTLSY